MKFNPRRICVAYLLILLISIHIWATDRFFSDILELSPDGRWRLELRSPDNKNADGRHVAFQSHFTYTLFEVATGKELWSQKQGENDASPVSAWLNNERWVVIRTGWDQLIAFDPNGKVSFTCALLDKCFDQAERKKYVHETTAGPRWAGRSFQNFFEVDGKPFFGIRTWWGKHMVFDLAKGYLPNMEPEIQASLQKSETDFVLKSLALGVETLEKVGTQADEEWKKFNCLSNVFTAAHMAGKMNIKEAIPFLAKLQFSEYSGRSGGRWDNDIKEGEVNPFNSEEFDLRRIVQLALRRLGEKPADLPGYKFRLETKANLGPFVPDMKFELTRAQRIKKVKPGMTPLEVLRVMGAPDAIDSFNDAWEYDMDGEKPYTSRVTWKKQKVKKCADIEPPVWMGEERDFDLAN